MSAPRRQRCRPHASAYTSRQSPGGWHMRLAWLLILLTGPIAVAADAQPDPWSPVRFLVGKWAGEAQGEPGKGSVERSYEFVLGDKFIEERNTSQYEPKAGQKGEVHL